VSLDEAKVTTIEKEKILAQSNERAIKWPRAAATRTKNSSNSKSDQVVEFDFPFSVAVRVRGVDSNGKWN
jgi:hypothetical protein